MQNELARSGSGTRSDLLAANPTTFHHIKRFVLTQSFCSYHSCPICVDYQDTERLKMSMDHFWVFVHFAYGMVLNTG